MLGVVVAVGVPRLAGAGINLNSADAALWHAEHDGGITFALSYQVAEAVKAGRLRIVLEAFEPPALPIHFVYPSSRLLSAKVRTFVELAAATCDWRF